MYKVLLVDDEPMAVEGLRYIVDWGKLGFWVCATCENGKEAVDAIDEYHPDVIITDIKMPVMDGLDLIQHTKEHGGENVKFIVVSGYAEFEYAKKAMQYDVRYYLQKPILKEEIDEIIIEVKEQLDQMQRSRKCSEIDQKAELDYVLSQILLGSNSPRDFEYVECAVAEEIIMRLWNCVVIEIEASDDMDIRGEFKNIRLKVRGAIDEAVKNYSDFFVFDHDLNKFIILLGIKNNAEHDNTINNVARSVFQSLDSIVPFGFTIGVGENVEGINGLKHAYDTARTALGHRFYMGLKCLIFYNEIKKIKFKFEFNDLIMSDKVLEAVEELDKNKIRNIIDTIFEFFKVNTTDPEIVIMFTSNMIYKINNLISQVDDKQRDLINIHTICEIRKHERSMQTLKEFFEGFCLGYCEYFENVRSRNAESNIIKIEAFVKENYKRNITLRELAENMYMHPAYLGQLFIQKFGMGFNEYVHKLRMEEAKRLMKGTILKNHEIAQRLGYCNYNSFLIQFQKYMDMKPTEFRNSEH